MEKITKLGEDLKTGLQALQTAQEKQAKDTDGLVKAQVERVANDIGAKLEEQQQKMASYEAAVQRIANGAGSEKADDKEAREKKEAFVAYLRAKGDVTAMKPEQVKALSTDNLANGGYLVTAQMLGVINARVFETSPVRKVANIIKTSHKSVEVILDDDEAGAGWAGEGDTPTETNTPQLGRVEIVAKKLYAYPKTTNELLADAEFDVEAWLTGKIGDRFSRLENTAFLTGDGVSRPRGILTYNNVTTPGTYERGKIEQIANGSASAPTEVGLISFLGSLKEEYQARASLLMKRATFVQYLTLSGTNVFRFFNLQPNSGSQGTVLGTSLSLLEKPVYLADDMPVIANNALAVAYGDFSRAYTIVDRTAVSVLRDPYTAPGMTKFYAEKRVGGGVTNFEAVKLLRMSAS